MATPDEMKCVALHQVGINSAINELIRKQESDEAQKTLGDCLIDIGKAFDKFNKEAEKFIEQHKKHYAIYEIWNKQEIMTLDGEHLATEEDDDPEYCVLDKDTGERMGYFDDLEKARQWAEEWEKGKSNEQD